MYPDYLGVASTLAENNIQSIVVGDIGILGYYSNAYVWDYLGLITPEAIPCWNNLTMSDCIVDKNMDAILIVPRFNTIPQLTSIFSNPKFQNYHLLDSFGSLQLYVQ